MSSNPFINNENDNNNQNRPSTQVPEIHVEEPDSSPLDPPPEYSEFDPLNDIQGVTYSTPQTYSRPPAQAPAAPSNNWAPILPQRPVSPRLPARPRSGVFPGAANATYNNISNNPPLPPRRF